jgi:hypothetical protein
MGHFPDLRVLTPLNLVLATASVIKKSFPNRGFTQTMFNLTQEFSTFPNIHHRFTSKDSFRPTQYVMLLAQERFTYEMKYVLMMYAYFLFSLCAI